jgi:hypothetical protein
MLIPFGILSSAAGVVAEGDYELIASEILTASQSSITFSNLGDYSSTYKHLQVRMVARSDNADTNSGINLRFNSDTGSNYDFHQLLGNIAATIITSTASLNLAQTGGLFAAGNNSTASAFGGAILDILDVYAAKHKTLRSLSGIMGEGEFIALRSGAWRDTSSVTSITFFGIDRNFVAGSRLSLYGIRG